jgi:hypothetical protein
MVGGLKDFEGDGFEGSDEDAICGKFSQRGVVIDKVSRGNRIGKEVRDVFVGTEVVDRLANADVSFETADEDVLRDRPRESREGREGGFGMIVGGLGSSLFDGEEGGAEFLGTLFGDVDGDLKSIGDVRCSGDSFFDGLGIGHGCEEFLLSIDDEQCGVVFWDSPAGHI